MDQTHQGYFIDKLDILVITICYIVIIKLVHTVLLAYKHFFKRKPIATNDSGIYTHKIPPILQYNAGTPFNIKDARFDTSPRMTASLPDSPTGKVSSTGIP